MASIKVVARKNPIRRLFKSIVFMTLKLELEPVAWQVEEEHRLDGKRWQVF